MFTRNVDPCQYGITSTSVNVTIEAATTAQELVVLLATLTFWPSAAKYDSPFYALSLPDCLGTCRSVAALAPAGYYRINATEEFLDLFPLGTASTINVKAGEKLELTLKFQSLVWRDALLLSTSSNICPSQYPYNFTVGLAYQSRILEQQEWKWTLFDGTVNRHEILHVSDLIFWLKMSNPIQNNRSLLQPSVAWTCSFPPLSFRLLCSFPTLVTLDRPSDKATGLSPGAVVGIVVACCVIVALTVAFFIWLARRGTGSPYHVI